MVYGDEKAREMARSLLPSKNREPARKSRAVMHRAERRRSRMEAAQLARDPEASEDLALLDDGTAGEMRGLVAWRRAGDKLGPFIRWACATTRELPRMSRLSHIRSRVPRGVIGDHALGHLAWRKEFEHPNEAAVAEARRLAWIRRRRDPRMDRGELAELLRALLQAPDGHRAFNRWLQRSHPVPRYQEKTHRRACTCKPGCPLEEVVHVPVEPIRARMLLGAHDVLPFLDALWGAPKQAWWTSAPGAHAQQRDAVERFLRLFKEHRGDVAATARALGRERELLG